MPQEDEHERETKMSVQAVCFDLDGTLLDTLEEIAVSANAVLERHGLPVHPVPAYRYFVGDGVRRLIKRVLPPDQVVPDRVSELTRELSQEYDRRDNELTQIYPGIESMLGALVERGIPLAVLSNKPHALTLACLERFFPQVSFSVAMGQQDDIPRKPDPAGALRVASTMGLKPGAILYLGDTDVDMKTASAAGMIPAGVLWGFRDRAELERHGAAHLLENPAEVLILI